MNFHTFIVSPYRFYSKSKRGFFVKPKDPTEFHHPNLGISIKLHGMNRKSLYVALALITTSFLHSCERKYTGNSSSSEPTTYTQKNQSKKQSARKEISGIAIKVSDGDTFTILFDNGFEIHLTGAKSRKNQLHHRIPAKNKTNEI